MTSELVFLQPDPNIKSFDNIASGTGGLNFQSSKRSDAVLTSSEANTLVNGGVSAAIATAAATYLRDPEFSSIFNDSSVFGQSGTYMGEASSRAEILATYHVDAGDTLAFNFEAAIELKATEIDNAKQYYSMVEQGTKFLVLDLSASGNSQLGDDDDDDDDDDGNDDDRRGTSNRPKIIGYFGIDGSLESAQKELDKSLTKSRNVSLSDDKLSSDIDGNNGSDFLRRQVSGQFSETFSRQSNLAVIKITSSFSEISGDDLIGNLVGPVLSGDLGKDSLRAKHEQPNIYGSLGDDRLKGNSRRNILEGGRGNDRLWGYDGDDKLSGGLGDDYLSGGDDDDILVGGRGHDRLKGGSGKDYLVGVHLTQRQAGSGEIDELTGNSSNDKFVLGDQQQAYYLGGGNNDYALLTDFRRGRDVIWLHGQASDYEIDYARKGQGLAKGSRIYYTGSGSRDLVGLAEDVNLEGKLSHSSVFAYNQTVDL